MDYRNGKCSQCGAEYKIPSSFPHDVARCKVCEGVVNLEPAAAPTKPAAASEAVPPELPTLVEVETENAEGKRRERGTLAKLKAQRAAQAAGAKPTRPARPASRAATTAAVDEEPQEAESRQPSRARGSGARSSGARRSGTRGARGGGRSRATRSESKGKNPALLVLVVLIVVAGGAAFLLKDKLFATDTEVAAAEGTEEATGAEGTESTGEAEGSEAFEDPAPTEDAATASTDVGSATPAESGDDGGSEPEEQPAAKQADPDSVDLDAVTTFGPAPGTTDEEWAEINDLVNTFMDLDAGAAGGRAGRKLVDLGRKAYPAIVNAMTGFDYSTETDVRRGDMCQRTLMEICNGNNFEWRYETTPDDEYFNKKVVTYWATFYERSLEDIEKWIELAKLDKVAPDEADALRAQFGSPEDDPFGDVDDGGGDDFGDDLDVD